MRRLGLHDRPLADKGLISYRYRGRYGWVMIGARDDRDALREAARSVSGDVSLDNLQVWDGSQYQPVNSHRPNGRATVADPTAARELDLYIANTYELVGAPNSIGKSIDANLKRKLEKGTYDSALAPKAWQHLVDEGAKRYEREFGSGSPIFNAATRRQVAADFANAWEEENKINPLSNSQMQEDDYVMTVTDRDGRIGVYCIKRDGKWRGPLVNPTASSDAAVRAMERDARDRGVHAAAVFEYEDGTRGLRQVGNVVNGRYQESGGHRPNGARGPRYEIWAPVRSGEQSAWMGGFTTLKLARDFAKGEERRKPWARYGDIELRDDGHPIERYGK